MGSPSCFSLTCTNFLQNFKFKQLSNVQISEAADYGDERYSLLCVSNEFGLTFVGTKDGKY